MRIPNPGFFIKKQCYVLTCHSVLGVFTTSLTLTHIKRYEVKHVLMRSVFTNILQTTTLTKITCVKGYDIKSIRKYENKVKYFRR